MLTNINEPLTTAGSTGAQAVLPSAEPSSLAELSGTAIAPQKIAFIDASLDDIDGLVSTLTASAIHIIDADIDGVSYISDVLAQYGPEAVDSVHIFSHGRAGRLQLGKTALSSDDLTGYSEALSHWGTSTTGDILLYGCDVAKSAAGISFIEQLSAATGGDIQASTDLTGSALLGGDWALEATVGEIETEVAITAAGQLGYAGVLRAITSDGGGDTATVSVEEGEIVVTDVQSSSSTNSFQERNGVTYSIIGGDDSTLFRINVNTGVLRFRSAPDFEAPTDSNSNNAYLVRVGVSDDAGETDDQLLTVNVTDVNEDPVIPGDPPVITSSGGGDTASLNVDEGEKFVVDVNATSSNGDVERNGLTYSLNGGEDVSLFRINKNTGVVRFKRAPDFETPEDSDSNNLYEVSVEVKNSTGATDSQLLQVTVDDIDDGGGTPLAITSNGGGSNASVDVSEGETFVTDVNTTGGSNVTYSLNAGEDVSLFNIDAQTGVISFKLAPDFENPEDTDGNNTYLINVLAQDTTGQSDSQFLVVSVRDVVESGQAPTITSDANPSVLEGSTLAVDIDSTDPDGDVEGDGISYRINAGPDRDRFDIDENTGEIFFLTEPDFENPDDANGDNVYQINVLATDSTGLVASQFVQIRVTNKVSVYLFGGQSNMAGVGSDANDLSGAQANPLPDVQIWQDGINSFVDLRPGFNRNFGNGAGFGAELGFGFALEAARDSGTSDTEEIYLVKYALGSTSLAEDWAVNGQNNTYDDFKDWVGNALNKLTSQGIGYSVEGMMWMQGEQDAFNASQAANYQSNLTGFISDIRQRYGQSVDFVIGRLHDELPNGFFADEVVRSAQTAVANADSRNYLVNTDSYPVSSDSVHFTSAGHLSLGEDFAPVFI
ncbi:MAG: DUF4347 domain-containing protein [Cyanobacteria bacterium J06606_4]